MDLAVAVEIKTELERLQKDLAAAADGRKIELQKLKEDLAAAAQTRSEVEKLRKDLAEAAERATEMKKGLDEMKSDRDRYLELCLDEEEYRQSKARNIYELLRISRKMTKEEKRIEYKKLTRCYHPDKFNNHQKATEITKNINVAYSIASKPIHEEAYNRYLEFGDTSEEAIKKTNDSKNSQRSFCGARDLVNLINNAQNYLEIINYSPTKDFASYSLEIQRYVNTIAWSSDVQNTTDRRQALERLRRIYDRIQNQRMFLLYVRIMQKNGDHQRALQLTDETINL